MKITLTPQSILSLCLLVALLGFSSCTDDPTTEAPTPANPLRAGVFIINEGNFGSGNGAVKFVGTDSGTIEADTLEKAFQTTNNRPLGDVVQSMAMVNDSIAYIVVNNDNKIEVMNTNDFSAVKTIQNLHLPRHILKVTDNKAYVSNWGTFNGDVPAHLSIIDLNTNTVSDTITLGSYLGSDRLYLQNGKVYVMNNFTGSVSVVDVATDKVENTIEVSDAPSTAVSDGNSLWVLCSGGYGVDFGSNDDDTPAAIAQISLSSQSVITTATIGNLGDHPSRMVMTADNLLLLAHAGAIWEVPTSTLSLASNPLIEGVSAYGLSLSPSNLLYIGDANFFAGEGTVSVYNLQGQLQETYPSGGVGPSGFMWLGR